MKMVNFLTMFIALLIAPIAGASSYGGAGIAPGVHNVTNEEREEQELRRLLIERLKQENQSYARGGMSYADDSNEQIQSQKRGHFSKQAIIEKIKDMPWWGWIIVGGIGLAILGKFADD
ncbi:MAG: hypothetical protein IKO72_03090 [Kiritimatiellae bacterium]|nr:hypothetical protein [Kiritimatiellia bacterium]